MDKARRSEIRNIVEILMRDTALDNIFPAPLEQLTQMLGYTSYVFTPATPETKSISGAVDHAKSKILINRSDPLARQLFTLAHEIGHVILHKEKGNHIDYRKFMKTKPEDNEIEDEADLFAAEILMPKENFLAKWNEHNGYHPLIAAYFGVSQKASEIRKKELDKHG
jgi:Zn-dependent peptidase ImmA (M78 family)